jgi:hypothetical protein
VVEIYPRLLTGPVRKSDPAARARYLSELAWPPDPGLRELAASTEDAFDAAVSALAMWVNRDDLTSLPASLPLEAVLEGWIWQPSGAQGGTPRANFLRLTAPGAVKCKMKLP